MKSIDYLDKDYAYFIKADLEKYQGKYIAIHDGKIQICATSLREVSEFMKKKYPDIIPFITQVQSGPAVVL